MKNLSKEYTILLENIKQAIQAERTRAIQQLTRNLILSIGILGNKLSRVKRSMDGVKVS